MLAIVLLLMLGMKSPMVPLRIFLLKKITGIMDSLISWNKNEFGKVNEHIKSILAELQHIQLHISKMSNPVNSDIFKIETRVRERLNHWLNKEEIMWAPRSKQMWLQNGDRNTKYFHTLVKKRRATNIVTCIQDGNDMWINNYQLIKERAVDFYSFIFIFHHEIKPSKEQVVQWVPQVHLPTISEEQGLKLIQPVTLTEVKTTFFQMSP